MYVNKVAESVELFERVQQAMQFKDSTLIVMSKPVYMSTLVYPLYNYTTVHVATLLQIYIHSIRRAEKVYFGLISFEDVDLLLFKALKVYKRDPRAIEEL
jgi:hypothetical protein